MPEYIERTEHIGAVTGYSHQVDVTLSLDTSAYAAGDLLANAQEIVGAFRKPNQTAILHSLCLVDKDDQGAALDLYFTTTSTSWGTENAAVGPTDAVAGDIQGSVSIVADDYTDLGNSQEATIKNIGLELKAADSTSLYIAAVTRGTPTHTASGITIKLGLLLD